MESCLQAVLLHNVVPADAVGMFIHKPHNKVHILWWGSSQSAHSTHSNPKTRARKEALELDSLADSGLQFLETGQVLPGSSSLSWHPTCTHLSITHPTEVWRLTPQDGRCPYLECNLLLARSWSTPLAIEPLLICRPPRSLLPAVRATRSGSPRGGSYPFRSLRSRSVCPSVPPRLFFSFPATVSPPPSSSLPPQQWQLLRKWGMAHYVVSAWPRLLGMMSLTRKFQVMRPVNRARVDLIAVILVLNR